MSEEENIDELKRLLYTDTLTQYGKRKLISYYEKQIKDLQKENEEYSKQLDLDYVDNNYIPIQKVKDKIRKNEKIIDISNDGDLIHELYQVNKVYEELLEGQE